MSFLQPNIKDVAPICLRIITYFDVDRDGDPDKVIEIWRRGVLKRTRIKINN